MATPVRPNVLKLNPYVPGKPIEEVKRELGLDRVIKLASNENPLGPSPKAVAAIQEAAKNLHLYPDAYGYELKKALADRSGIPIEQVMLGNGSDELIHFLGMVLLDPGSNLVVADPTFVRYNASAELADVELRKVPLDGQYRHDLSAMAKACDENTRIVYVANPHNPTGTVVTKQDFDAFLNDLPQDTLAVLDEAYFEFAEHLPNNPDGTAYIKEGKNVVSFRTFSKTYGLAGIRIGYGFGPRPIVDAVERAREPFNTNILAQSAAIAALGDPDHLAKTKQVNQEGLDRIAQAAEDLGYKTIPSHANFICIDVRRPVQEVFQALLERGVIVRSGVPLGLPTMLRVSIGTPDEVTTFIETFQEVMSSE